MSKGNPKMKFQKLSFSLVFGVLVYSSTSYAQQMCVPYTDNGSVVGALPLAAESKTANAKNALTNYIKAASDPEKDIFRAVTKLDSSDVHIKQQLKEMPDLFSSYSGIKGFEPEQMLAFGNYIMFYANYDHVSGQAKLLETVLCTNLCQISNIMERPQIPEDLVSRFFQQIRVRASKAKTCEQPPGSVVNVNPSLQLNANNPLSIGFSDPVYKKPLSNISALNWGTPAGLDTPSSCDKLLATTFKGRSTDETRGPITQEEAEMFVEQCSVNMNINSAIPAVTLANGKREMMTSWVFASLIADATRLVEVSRIKNSEHEFVVVKLEGQNEYLIALPFVKQGNKTLLDWSQYGTAVGEVLTTSPIAQLYKQKVTN